MAEESERKALHPVNDNGSRTGEPLDLRNLRIAEAIGGSLPASGSSPRPPMTTSRQHGDCDEAGSRTPP
jgi:hypothetical protein